jgi:hypothetical protein
VQRAKGKEQNSKGKTKSAKSKMKYRIRDIYKRGKLRIYFIPLLSGEPSACKVFHSGDAVQQGMDASGASADPSSA